MDMLQKTPYSIVSKNIGKNWINGVRGDGIQELLYKLEKYLVLLTENMDMLQKTLYSVVSKNIGKYWIMV